MGVAMVNAKAFQSVAYDLPGLAKNDRLLMYEPNIDKPIAQPGSDRPAAMNSSVLGFLRPSHKPNPTTDTKYAIRTIKSTLLSINDSPPPAPARRCTQTARTQVAQFRLRLISISKCTRYAVSHRY